MDLQMATVIFNYPEAYEAVVKKGIRSFSEYREYMMRTVKTGKLSRRLELVSKGKGPFLSCSGDEIIFDEAEARKQIGEFADILGLDIGKIKELTGEMSRYDDRISKLEDRIREKDAEIERLQAKIHEHDNADVRAVMQKQAEIQNIEIGPQEHEDDDIFLNHPKKYLDVDKCVSFYGGVINSFYEEIPTDPQKQEGFESGREFTERNYKLRAMNNIGTRRLFEKRLSDIRAAKEHEQKTGHQLFPDNIPVMYKQDGKLSETQEMRNRILKNRFEAINEVIASDAYTNQEKLMFFAMNGEFRDTFVEKLLMEASRHCINADLLIYILQDPNVCDTYDKMVNFLDQFVNPSEFKLKLQFARELIAGRWYISADYNGRKTKFQLVPIDELNELRRKVGLPASDFHYKEKKVMKGGNASQHYDYPDDGLEMPKDP